MVATAVFSCGLNGHALWGLCLQDGYESCCRSILKATAATAATSVSILECLNEPSAINHTQTKAPHLSVFFLYCVG